MRSVMRLSAASVRYAVVGASDVGSELAITARACANGATSPFAVSVFALAIDHVHPAASTRSMTVGGSRTRARRAETHRLAPTIGVARRRATAARAPGRRDSANATRLQQLIPAPARRTSGAHRPTFSSRKSIRPNERLARLVAPNPRRSRDHAWGGYVGLTAIIFAETGLLVGFFLPGDSLIVTAGLLSRPPACSTSTARPAAHVASIIGNTVGYAIGRRRVRRLFTREDSLLFNKKHLYRAREFYERHGGATVIIARFMPIVGPLCRRGRYGANGLPPLHAFQPRGRHRVDLEHAVHRLFPG
jgi:membrane protein YqaA with SNARE-associated domain